MKHNEAQRGAHLSRTYSSNQSANQFAPMKQILLIEDDTGLVFTLTDRLLAAGYGVATALDGSMGLQQALRGTFDCVILDIMLPHKNGFDVCRELRQKGVFTPVLMLTARGQTDDKVMGLKLGADDYLTKPFETSELLARIEAQIRRSDRGQKAPALIYEFGDVQMDVRGMSVTRRAAPVELSAKEFQLLHYLIEHSGITLSRDEILNNVWGYDAMPTTRTVDTHIAWLRQKLEPTASEPRYILTVYGVGYKFVTD
jgi:two-component system, OmpR family, alkaline phosphatase synthesis response regulator PhoP